MKKTTKRFLSTALALAMVLSLMPATLLAPALAAETGGGDTNSANAAAFGFNTTAPADFNAGDGLHPFGISGTADKTNLMPVREISMMTSTGYQDSGSSTARVFNFNETTIRNGSLFRKDKLLNISGEQFSSASPQFSTSSGNIVFRMASGVAYDPTGSGRDDHVFYYGPRNSSSDNSFYMQDISYTGGTQGAVIEKEITPASNNSNKDEAYTWMQSVDSGRADDYLSVTAGDFNGDGKETVVIYDPEFASVAVREYVISGNSLSHNSAFALGDISIPVASILGSGGNGSTLNSLWLASGSDRYQTVPSVHLTAGDLDGDHKDELVVTVTPRHTAQNYFMYSNASQVLVLKKDGSSWQLKASKTLDIDSSYDVLNRAVSVIGDMDGDNRNEIITVGYRLMYGEAAPTSYAYTTLQYSSGSLSGGSTYHDLSYLTANSNAPSLPSVGLVRLEGIGTKPYLFVSGMLFQYTGGTGSGGYEQHSDINSVLSVYLGATPVVRQPIIGNFDGNSKGKEQILFATDHSAQGQSAIMGLAFERTDPMLCYWSSGTDALGRVVLTAPDTDTDDGLVVHYTGKDYEYTNPEVLAVLLASPYFEDLLDEYENVGATGFGTSKGTEHAASSTATNSVGAYVSFEQDISLFGLIDIASFEFETAYNYEWSQTNETANSYTTSISFETGSGANQVVLICTPAIVYHYDVLGTDGTTVISTNDVTVTQKPCYIMIPVEDYNTSARRLGNPVIDNSSVVDVIPGQPTTYPSTKEQIDSVGAVATSDMPVTAGYGNAVIGYEVSTEQSSSVTKEYTHNVEVKSGGGVVGFKVGATYGHSWSTATTTSNISGVTRAGSVANIPAGNTDYSLSWQFATWDINIGEGQRQYKVPVMGYLVSNVSEPPSVPQNLTAMPDTNSVTLNWDHGHSSAVEYEIFRYFPDDPVTQYQAIGTVSGSASTFTCTGLNPGTRYYFSIRAVGADGLCSKYAEPVMVTTSSEYGLPTIYTQPQSQSVPVGASVTFSTDAIPASGSIGYIWQSRESAASKWVALESATGKKLTLSDVTTDMDGTQYRCRISQVDGGESATFVYTDTATLTVGKYDTSTTLTLSNGTEDNYMGFADHTETRTKEQTVKKNVTESTGSTVYTKYQNTYGRTAGEKPYVYSSVDSDSESGSAKVKFWLPGTLSAEGTLTNETTMTELTALEDWVVAENGTVVAKRAMAQKTAEFYPTAAAVNPVTCKAYTATVYTVTKAPGEGGGYDVTETEGVTLYEYTPDGGTTGYYQAAVDAEAGKFVLSSSPLTETTDINFTSEGTYYLRDTLTEVWSGPATETGSGGKTYKIYAPTGSSGNLYENGGTFYTKAADTYTKTAEAYYATAGLYGILSEDKTTVSSMVQVGSPMTTSATEQVKYTSRVPGEEVTLTAAVTTVGGTPGSGTVSFQITNTATGAVSTQTATISGGAATAKWTPSAAGVYTIKAVYSGSTTMNPSSSNTATYYAKETDSIYEIVLGSALLYGDTVSPALKERTSAEAAGSNITATFKVNGYNSSTRKYDKPMSWESTPLVPGEYRVDAYVSGSTEPVAQKVFTVTKRPIIISAPTISPIGEGSDPKLSTYAIRFTEADGKTTCNLEDAYKALFCLTGVSATPTSGNYDITVAYQNSSSTTAAEFRSRYQPTFEKSVLTVTAEAVTITFSAGENGTVTGYELGDTTTTAFTSPYSISKDGDVRFVPNAAPGFAVSKWTIDGTAVTQNAINSGAFTAYGTVSLDAGSTLRISGVQKTMVVKVEFSNVTHTVWFSGIDNGSVTATQGTTSLSSPSTVVEGSSVTLTAAPNADYVVKSWSISRDGGTAETKKNPDGTNYTGTTLTLDDIDADLTVHAEFELAGSLLAVTCGAVDTDGIPAAEGLVTLTAEGLDENGKAQRGSTVTLTASSLQPGTGIQRWEVSTDGGKNWETKAGSTMAYTIYSLQDNTQVRVVLQTSTASYTVSYSIEGMLSSDSSAGTLTAKTGDTAISSGDPCVAYSSLVFTYVESKDYEFVRWEVTGTTGTETVNGTTHTCTISSLDANTTVKAVVRKKPLINVSDPANGTLTVKVSGTDTSIANGTYVYSGTQVTVTVTPDANYVVDTIKAGSTAIFNGDKTNGAKSNAESYTVSTDTAFTATLTEKPTVTIGSVSNGTVSVTGTLNGSSKALTSGDHVDFNSTIKVTATPGSGYVVDDITVTGVENGNLLTDNRTNGDQTKTSNAINANVTVSAAFLTKPIVSIGTVEGGTVEAKGTKDGTAGTTINSGDYVDFNAALTVTLKPAKGYEVGEITGYSPAYTDGTGTTTDDKTYTIPGVSETKTIAVPQAWAELSKYSVTYSVVDGVNGNGALTASVDRKGLNAYKVAPFNGTTASDPDSVIYKGSTVTFKATPETGYRVKEWTVNGIAQLTDGVTNISQELTLDIPGGASTSDFQVTVKFMLAGNSVTATAGSNGKIVSAWIGNQDEIGNIGTGIVLSKGASVVLAAQPNAGYEVEKWTVNGVDQPNSSSNTYTYTAQTEGEGAVINVFFRPVEYTVAWGGTNGTVTATGYTGASADIRGGETVTFTATPSNGYVVSGWKVNGATVDGQIDSTFIWTVPNGMASDPQINSYAIEAIFGRGSYTVSWSGDHATVTAAGYEGSTATITGDTQVTFTAEPIGDFIVIDWKVDGVSQGVSGNTFTLKITKNTAVAAVLVPGHYDVTYAANETAGGTVKANGFDASPASVAYGESITFTANPNPYYHVSGWMVGTELQEGTANQNTFTLTNVTAECTVTAVFEAAIRYNVYYSVNGTGGTLSAVYEDGTALDMTSNLPQLVWGGSDLTFTAAPNSEMMVAKWEISTDGGSTWTEITRDNLASLESIGVSMEHYLSNKLTVTNLRSNLYVKASFTAYEGYAIPTGGTGYAITGVERTPAETYDGADAGKIRKNGDVTFTVAPAENKYLASITVNGTPIWPAFTESTGTENKLTVQNNGDGTLTITVVNVTRDIVLNVEALEFQTVQNTLTEVPDGLQSIYGTDVNALQTALRTAVTRVDSKVPTNQMAFFDIKLQYRTGNGDWQDADPNHFPAGGITVTIPYSDLGSGVDSTYDFTVIHMFTTDMNGHTIGDTERITLITKTATGISFTVTSLSPFAIGWSKYVAPAGGGGGGGGAVLTETVVIKDSANGKVTVSDAYAEKGDTVTLTVTPDEGYALDELTVTDSNGTEIVLTPVGTNKYTFTMPASAVSVKATFAAIDTACDGGVNCPVYHFSDVDTGKWYHEALDYVVENGIMNGIGNDLFAPNGTLQRCMLMTMLARMDGVDTSGGSPWYEKGMQWAMANGISDGTNPTSNISREQIAAMLYRYAQLKGYDTSERGSLAAFKDGSATSSWAVESMQWAVGSGLLKGSNGMLNPTGNATRAEVAQMLLNFNEWMQSTK